MRVLWWFLADRMDMMIRPNYHRNERIKFLIFVILMLTAFLIWAEKGFAQVTVALSPVAKQQFFSVAGAPLASGCVNTYTTGTSTPLATYTDGTGATQNSNPIILDGGGFANIWLTNAAYRFVVVAYDGIPGNKCAAGITQYTVDAINAYAPISTGANLFLLGQSTDPAGTGGELIYRNDIPCIRAFTTLWDCLVTLTSTQTLTNKALTAPTITGPTITGGATISGGGSWSGSPSLTNPTISGVNAQTGASYTVAATDEQKLVTFANGGAVAVTLPQASTAGFGAGTVFHFKNIGSGTVTITPTTSTIDTTTNVILSGVPGGAIAGAAIDVYSDGTNYFTQRGFFTSTGAVTSNHLVSWNTAGVVQDAGLAIVPPSNVLISSTAPTIASGFGAAASIVASNGPSSFTVNVGTGGAASTGSINLPTAAHGWNCFAIDITNPTVGGGISTKQTGGTTTQITLTGYNATPVATAWTASDILQVSCFGN